ncbi:UNVERIFIED_CONTAM: hypothetical protein RMT77_018719 [Armadillidium vulgare]
MLLLVLLSVFGLSLAAPDHHDSGEVHFSKGGGFGVISQGYSGPAPAVVGGFGDSGELLLNGGHGSVSQGYSAPAPAIVGGFGDSGEVHIGGGSIGGGLGTISQGYRGPGPAIVGGFGDSGEVFVGGGAVGGGGFKGHSVVHSGGFVGGFDDSGEVLVGGGGFGIRCGPGQIHHLDGRCVSPQVTRSVYVYSAPKLPVARLPRPLIPKPRINYNVVFVRTPDFHGDLEPIVVPPPQQKTLVYVLTRNGQIGQKVIEIPAGPEQRPEVFYVNYNDGDNPVLHGGLTLQDGLRSAVNHQGRIIGGGGFGGGLGGQILKGGGLGGGHGQAY